MRHKRTYRKLGRSPKHRISLFRNLATQLFTHERIVTTEHKARELRPLIEKLVHKSRDPCPVRANRFLKQKLFTGESMKNLMKEIRPRMDEMGIGGGFTRITQLGRRNNDRAKIAMIEIVGNQEEKRYKASVQERVEKTELPDFWLQESTMLQDEQFYYKEQLNFLQATMDDEIDASVQKIVDATGKKPSEKEMTEIQVKLQQKYNTKQVFLLKGLKRALDEWDIHCKQSELARYWRYDQKYYTTNIWDIRQDNMVDELIDRDEWQFIQDQEAGVYDEDGDEDEDDDDDQNQDPFAEGAEITSPYMGKNSMYALIYEDLPKDPEMDKIKENLKN